MWINLSAEQERQIRDLVRANATAHWEADCELPGWGLTINICSLDTWVEIDVDNSVHDIGSACVDFGTIFDEDNPRLARKHGAFEKIERVLTAVRAAWIERPNWRLGQLLLNAIQPAVRYPELYEADDAELLDHLARFANASRDSDFPNRTIRVKDKARKRGGVA